MQLVHGSTEVRTPGVVGNPENTEFTITCGPSYILMPFIGVATPITGIDAFRLLSQACQVVVGSFCYGLE